MDRAIKHVSNPSFTESTAARDHPTGRAVPAHILSNLYKTLPMHVPGTDSDPSVQGLPRVAQPKARDALQLEMHPPKHVSGTPLGGPAWYTVITFDTGRFSPPNLVRIQART